jgi:UDP-glucose 4-epimerase
MSKILITGGAGFIGQHLVSKLLCEGRHRVVVIDNLSSRKDKCLQRIDRNRLSSSPTFFAFYKEDLRNKKQIHDIIKCERIDTCIHLAAKVCISQSMRNPNETMDVNINGTLNLLEACSHNKIMNFIFASSASVYGRSPFLPLSEELPLEPLSPYGVSKVAGEALVLSYRNSDKIRNALCLRIFNVYGKGQNSSYAGVVTRFANRLSRRLPPVIYSDGKQTRDFISVDDVVRCIILAVEAQHKGKIFHVSRGQRPSSFSPAGAFNVGTGIPVSVMSLAKKMIKMSGLQVKPIYSNRMSKGEPRHSYANTIMATQILKFKAEEKLEYGIKKLLFNRRPMSI